MPSLTSAENQIIRTSFDVYSQTEFPNLHPRIRQKYSKYLLSASAKLCSGSFSFVLSSNELLVIRETLSNFLCLLDNPSDDLIPEFSPADEDQYRSLIRSAAEKLSLVLA